MSGPIAFLFDLDGTLVDSVYTHVRAWHLALSEEGIELSVWRIHRKIGMSGGLFTHQLLRELGRTIDHDTIQRLRARHSEHFLALSSEVVPLPGAIELLETLTRLDLPWAIATSGRMETASGNLESLGIDRDSAAVVTRDQVT